MIKNLKKVISSAAAVAIVASSASAFAVDFPDVDESASYANAVDTVSGLGVIVGDDNGLFNPDNNVTRAEFTTMVVRALGEEAAATATVSSSFTDAANTDVHWAAGYIAQGVSDGWINGYGDGTFRPDNTVTYQEAVKMLVSAIGYELYAQNAGGYPSGYLSYGNSTGILDGVSVPTQTTELTRAQCAVLVNNAMQAPLVLQGDITVGGSLGLVTEQSYTTMNGTGTGWQTLLTKFHDAYVVRGRVIETSRTTSGGLSADEVTFRVEAADNFDGEYYGRSNNASAPETFQMKVGTTDAANMMFEYAEAVVQEDEDTGDWVIISIAPYGQSQTVTFATSRIDDEDSDYPADKMISRGRIPVFREGSTSTSTTKYRLNETGVDIYVNGVEDDTDTPDAVFNQYAVNNSVGTVTLIDVTDDASTSTDGRYDLILIDYYADAVVDEVSETSSGVRVNFKASEEGLNRLTWDPEDDSVDVTFTKDDAAIAYTDVQEYDVLSIAYDVTASDFSQSSFYEVIVSSNTVSGTVTGRNATDEVITIDGNQYEVNSNLYSINDFELSTDYTLYLDAFGYIAYQEEGESSKNYGVVIGMYSSNAYEYAIIRLINSSGEIVEYEARDAQAEDDFYQILTGENWDAETSSDITRRDQVVGTNGEGLIDNVVSYSVTSSGIRLKERVDAVNSVEKSDLQFSTTASSSRLGNYTIADGVTIVLDLESYINGDDPGVMSVSSFTEDADYTAYVYDRSSTSSTYRLVLLTSGMTSINAETALAVVKTTASMTEIDGSTYYTMTVARDGAEDVTLTVEDGAIAGNQYNEGDVLVYTTNSDGYVEDGNIYKVIDMTDDDNNIDYSSYDALKSHVLGLNDFNTMIEPDVVSADDSTVWKWSTPNKETNVYFGPVYSKTASNIDLIVSKQDDGSSSVIDDVESFAIDTADVYVYDYSSRANKGTRVTAGNSSNVTDRLYRNTYLEGTGIAADTFINWSVVTDPQEDINPYFALVKVVENDVTEVVIYAAD